MSSGIVYDSSDEDSIATNTTAESEKLDEYFVEQILAEKSRPEKKYLVKWEGYKLFRATWEPRDCVANVLSSWVETKRKIKAGDEQPFDVAEYEAAVAQAEQERKAKRRRRNIKRQKRGLPIKPDASEADEVDDDEEEEEEVQDDAPKRVARRQPLPPRKGVAQKVTRKPPVVSDTDTSSSDDNDDSKSSGGDSLQEELIEKAAKRQKSVSSASGTAVKKPKILRASEPSLMARSTTASTATTAAPGKPEAAKNITTAQVTRPPTSQASHPAQSAPPTAAKKSAPSHAASAGPSRSTAKRSGDILANWDAPKQRRERQRVSGETPKDSHDPKFRSLGVQGRYQKYGRENEKPPDINALTAVDPKTGKTMPLKATTASTPASAAPRPIPRAYGRRTPPPERRKSPTPPSQDRTIHNPAIRGDLMRPVCRSWLTTGCEKSVQDCDSVHPLFRNEITEFVPKSGVACWFWLSTGNCKYGSACEFAHSDTGVYPNPPGGGHGRRFFTVTLPAADAQQSVPQRSYQAPALAPAPIPAPAADSTKPSCRKWLEGGCEDPTCPWAHAYPDPTRPFTGNPGLVPKYQTYCHWKATRGGCANGDSCAFSHVDTGVRAMEPGSFLRGRVPSIETGVNTSGPHTSGPHTSGPHSSRTDLPKDTEGNTVLSKFQAEAFKIPLKDLTCFFWRTARCRKGEDCIFSHRNTGLWASPPGGFKTPDGSIVQGDGYRMPDGSVAQGHRYVPSALQDATSANATSANATPVGSHNRAAASRSSIDIAAELEPMDITASPMETMPPPPRGREPTRRVSFDTSEPMDLTASPSEMTQPASKQSTRSVAASLSISFPEGDPMLLQVSLDVPGSFGLFGSGSGAEPNLSIDRAILASDFERSVWPDLPETDAVGGVTISDIAMGQRLVDLCKFNTIGFIATISGKSSKMLIYPRIIDQWKFLDAGSSNWASESIFRFRLFRDLPGADTVPTPSKVDTRPSVVRVGEALAKLDPQRLLPGKEGDSRAAFIMFPSTHHTELAFYTKFFHAQKCKVYSSETAGAWAYFCQQLPASFKKVVVLHPEVAVWEIPFLQELLWTNAGIFSIGVNPTYISGLKTPTFGCERLFAIGTAVLMTDDVFMYHPERACEVIDSFTKTHRAQKRREYKLVTRPGVKVWLQRMAEESVKQGETDDRWARLYESMWQLCQPEDEDVHDMPNPSPDSNLVSLSPELMPRYASMWEQDEAAATNWLVEWYAGWSIENPNKLRKFYIFHETKDRNMVLDKEGRRVQTNDPCGWAKKYQHIMVQRPEDIFRRKP